jgi:hypothetical protein
MYGLIGTAALFAALGAPTAGPERGAATGLTEGTWRVLRIVEGAPSGSKDTAVWIAGNRLVIAGGGTRLEYRVAGTWPVPGATAVDLRVHGRTYRGVYRADGDRLFLCVQFWARADERASVRPKSFADAGPANGLGPTLYVLGRE